MHYLLCSAFLLMPVFQNFECADATFFRKKVPSQLSQQLFMGLDEQKLIASCATGDRMAQKLLYMTYHKKLFGVCLRYAKDRTEAEDFLQEGFITIFKDLPAFKGIGSFEGWMRKVVLNTVFQSIRKNKRQIFTDELNEQYSEIGDWQEPDLDLPEPQKLLCLMQQLPLGFRTVLNLYVIEGYSHQQIAEELGISVGTSKSQLHRAKEMMRKRVEYQLIK